MLGIPSPLHKLRDFIGDFITSNPTNRRDIIEDITQLIRSRCISRDLELEITTLLLCVSGVIARLVFCGYLACCCGCLLEDVEGARRC